jgi:uncharacterized membrane protein YbhN (UPF0104 family)
MTEAEETQQERPGRRWLDPLNVLRIALMIAPWAFIAYLYRDTGELQDAFEDATPALLVGSLALVLVAVAGIGVIWVALVLHLGGQAVAGVGRRALLRTYARSWIARYIPGVAWTFGARFVHTKEGIPRRLMAASMADEFGMMAATTTSVGLGLWLWGVVNVWLGVGVLAVTLAASVIFAMHVNRMAHWALDRVGRLLPERFRSLAEELEAEDGRTELSLTASARFSALFALVAVASGLAFYLALLSLTDVSAGDIPEAVGAYNLATMISIAVIIVPAGLGVREASLAAFVTPIVSEPVAATAALVYRGLTLLADAIFLLAAEAIAARKGEGGDGD